MLEPLSESFNSFPINPPVLLPHPSLLCCLKESQIHFVVFEMLYETHSTM